MDIIYSNVKLVIWDLDDSFWQGTLSEGNVLLPQQNRELIIRLSERGIINSICSKNNPETALKKLTEFDVNSYFVFASINWDPKGKRIRTIIDSMNLRAENVLFIDDNISNQMEAQFYCPGLMTDYPEVASSLLQLVDTLGKSDERLCRLQHYKTLEARNMEQRTFSSNDEFLYNSQVEVEILHDVEVNEERLHELVLRTNQLNFTKKRDTAEIFHQLLLDPQITSGYVRARDRYADYGIVGFYAVRENKVVHFVFSCRIIGMGIEQYVYAILHYPAVDIQAPVSGSLERDVIPQWINSSTSRITVENATQSALEKKVILKGPCDLEWIACFLHSSSIDRELFYESDAGEQIEIQCATQNIINSVMLSSEEIDYLRDRMPFYADSVFKTKIFDATYGLVILSIVADFNFGLYRHKSKAITVALGQDYKDITDSANWDGYVNGDIYNGNSHITYQQLGLFAKDFDKAPLTGVEIVRNLDVILDHLAPSTKLVIIVGSELDSPRFHHKNQINRAMRHAEANRLIKIHFSENARVHIINPNDYIASESDYIGDNINHHCMRIRHRLANDIFKILGDEGVSASQYSMYSVLKRRVMNTIHRSMCLLTRGKSIAR